MEGNFSYVRLKAASTNQLLGWVVKATSICSGM